MNLRNGLEQKAKEAITWTESALFNDYISTEPAQRCGLKICGLMENFEQIFEIN